MNVLKDKKAYGDPDVRHLVYAKNFGGGIVAMLVYSDDQVRLARKNRQVVHTVKLPQEDYDLFLDSLVEKHPCPEFAS